MRENRAGQKEEKPERCSVGAARAAPWTKDARTVTRLFSQSGRNSDVAPAAALKIHLIARIAASLGIGDEKTIGRKKKARVRG